MADGVRFDIAIEANALGVDATTDQLNALADKVTFTNKVATEFDRAVAAVRSRLDEATSATKAAAAALGLAETKYKELEGAANKAAKEVEKAKLAGKDTGALQAASEAAAAAMKAQAAITDDLRAKSVTAAAAQTKLGASLKTLEGQQAQAAAGIKSGIAKDLAGAGEATKKLGAAGGELKKTEKGLNGVSASSSDVIGYMKGLALAVGLYTVASTVASHIMLAQPAAMMRINAASQRMELGLKNLFVGLKFDKFVGALEDIGTTSSANGMKVIVETILQPLLDGAAKAGPFVKEMFKGIIYGVLQVIIAVLKIRQAIFNALSPETRATIKSIADQVFTLENAFNVGAGVAVILTAAFIALTVALIAMAVAEIAALWPILLIVAAIALVIAAIVYWEEILDSIVEVWDDLVDTISTAVDDIITGIVDGIKDGAGAVWQAMKDMALGGVKAFKSALGINSPSVVMAMQGTYTTQGFVEGIEDGTKDVDSAMETMVTPPDPVAPTGASAPTSGGSGSRSIVIQQLTIGDSPVASQTWADFKAMLSDALDGATITIGGGEAPAT